MLDQLKNVPRICEKSVFNLMLKSLLPNEVKVNITIGESRLRSKLATEKTKTFTKKSFFHAILGFAQSHSGPLNDPQKGFFQTIPRSCKIEKPNNVTCIDKVHLKCDCTNGITVYGVREIFFSFLHWISPQVIKYKRTEN